MWSNSHDRSMVPMLSALQVGTTALQVGDYRSALHIGIARSALQLYRSASPGRYRHEVGTIR
jgi:hypothetical protein